MKNHNFNSRYIILTLTIATLLAFFALQAGAVTTVTTPITGTVDTTRSGDIQILVSSDGSTISSDAGGDGIYADNGGAVSIDKMSGGPDSLAISADYFGIHVVGQSGDVQIGSGIGELTINSGRNGIVVETGSSTVGGTVSSDANLVINSSVTGVNNYGGTVDLTGVSIDVMGGIGIDTQKEQSVTRIRPSAGYHTISADGSGINAGQSGDVLIGRGSGELTINSGSDGDGVSVGSNGTVSSDADLVIKSGGYGVGNNGGTVNLAGVSIDSNSNGINTSGTQSVTRVRPSVGYHTISADYNGIYVSQSGDVQIGRGDGELTINSGGSYNAGVWVENGTVSSDADLVINSGGDGVYNYGGTVNLAGVSIDAKQGNGIVNMGTMVISGDQALIRAATSEEAAVAAIDNSGGSVSVKTSGDVLLAAKSNVSSNTASSLISNTGGGTVSIDAGGQVTFDVTAQSAKGLYNTASPAFGDGITVTAAKGSSYAVTSTSGDAYGLAASGNTTLAYGKVNSVTVNATGGDAYGLAALSRGTLSGDGANSISNLSVTENTADKTAYGVYASGDSKAAGISIDQLTVKSAGSAYGVNIASDKASSIDITNGLTVSGADANGGAGIYITGAGHSVNVGGALKATGVQYGVYNSGGAVNLAGVSIDAKGSGVSVNGDGQSIVSISPASGYDTINADDSGIAVNNSGKVLIGKGSGTLNINSGAHGVYAADGGIVSSDADLVIKSSGRGVFNNGGTVNLAGVSIDAKNDLGIYNKGGSLVISGDQTLVKAETTGSSAAYAISNSNNNSKSGSVSIDAVSVQLTARSAHGAAAAISNTGSGAVSIDTGAGGMELIVSAASGDAAAVSNTGGGTVSIKTAGQISYDITAQSAKGMYNTTSLGNGITVSAANGSSYKVTSTSGNAYGIAASGDTTLAYGKVNNVAVSATGGKAYGLAARNSGILSGDAAYKMQTLSVSSDNQANGIYADGTNSSVNDARVGQLTVNSGSDAIGILAASSDSVSADVDSMSVTGAAGTTYGVEGYNGTAKLAMNGNMDVRSTRGVAIGAGGLTNGNVSFSGVKSLNVSSDTKLAYGIDVESGGKINGSLESMNVYGGYGALGIYADLHTTVDLAMSGDLNVRGSGANAVNGVYALQGSAVTFTGVKDMTVSADGTGAAAYGINAAYYDKNNGTVSGDMQSLTVTSAHGAAYGIDVSYDKVSSIDIANGLTVSGANTTSGAGIYLAGAKHSVNVGGALKATGVKYGIYNNGGTVDPNGVYITASDNGIYTSGDQAVTQVSPLKDYALISAGADGVKAENSGQVLIGYGDGTPLVINSGSKGIEVASKGTVSSDADLVINSGSNGVYNNAGTVNLAGVSIDASPTQYTGAIDATAGGVTTIRTNKGGSSIAVNSGSGRGISAAGGGVVNVLKGSASSLTITQKDAMQFGIYADGSGSAVNSSADVVVSGQSIYNAAIEAANGGSVTIDGSVSADETGQVASGLIVRTGSGNKITVGGDYKASVTGYGILAKTATNSGYTTNEIDVKGNATIKGTGGNVGIQNDNAKVAIGGNADIATATASGISTTNDGTTTIGGSADITTTTASGIYNTGTTTIGGSAAITTTTGVGVSNAGTATVGGALTVRSGANAIENSGVFAALGGVSVDVASAGSIAGVSNTGSGNTTISGDKALIKAVTSGSEATAYAIDNEGTGAVSVDVSGNIELTAEAQNGYAAAVSGGNITLKSAGQVSFDVTGRSARGLYSNGVFNSLVTADGGSNYKVTSTSGDAYGITADASTLVYGKVNNVTVDAAGGNAYGLAAINNGDLQGDPISAMKNLSVTENTAGKTAYGVYADDGSIISYATIENASVNSKGAAYGVDVESNNQVSSINISNDLTVSGAEGGTGVTATGAAHNVRVGGLTDVSLRGGADATNAVYADDSSTIDLSGGLSADVASSGDARGVYVANEASVNVTGGKALKVMSENGSAYGVYDEGGVVSADFTSVSAAADKGEAYGVAINSYHQQSAVNISGDLTVKGAEGGTGVTVSGADNTATVGGLTDVSLRNGATETNAIYAVGSGTRIDLNGGLSADVAATGSGANAYGVRADGSGVVNVKGGKSLSVTSASGAAYGVDVESDQISSIGISGDLTVSGAAGGTGVTASLAAHNVTVDGLTNVSLQNGTDGTSAVYAADGSSINLRGGLSADVSASGNAYGIRAEGLGSFVAVENGEALKVSSTGAEANGVYAAGDGSVSADLQSLSVQNTAGAAYGINIRSNTISSVDIAGDVTVSGADGSGAGIYLENAAHNVKVGGSLTATGVQNGVWNNGGRAEANGIYVITSGDVMTLGLIQNNKKCA